MKTDSELHIIGSVVLTLTVGAVPALVIGALIEVHDLQFNDPAHCVKDMAANCIGVGIVLLIKKFIK